MPRLAEVHGLILYFNCCIIRPPGESWHDVYWHGGELHFVPAKCCVKEMVEYRCYHDKLIPDQFNAVVIARACAVVT